MDDRVINKSNCENASQVLIDMFTEGNGCSEKQLHELYNQHPECRAELKSIYNVWKGLGELDVEEPSSDMHVRFYKSLSGWQAEKNTFKPPHFSVLSFVQGSKLFIRKYGVAASILAVGILIGVVASNLLGNKEQKGMVYMTPQENNTINVKAMPSSQERMSEISQYKSLSELNDVIIEALNQALLKDPSSNVRLSAIEAMLHFADNPQVRKNLIDAIPYQTSPLVQLTLAEVMINLQEKASAEAWRELLDSRDMELDVRRQLEETLKTII